MQITLKIRFKTYRGQVKERLLGFATLQSLDAGSLFLVHIKIEELLPTNSIGACNWVAQTYVGVVE